MFRVDSLLIINSRQYHRIKKLQVYKDLSTKKKHKQTKRNINKQIIIITKLFIADCLGEPSKK